MSRLSSETSRGIFRQLADVAGGSGVKTVIENHDAWLHNDATEAEITSAIRAEAAYRSRPPEIARRIDAQRRALVGLVTALPARISTAG